MRSHRRWLKERGRWAALAGEAVTARYGPPATLAEILSGPRPTMFFAYMEAWEQQAQLRPKWVDKIIKEP